MDSSEDDIPSKVRKANLQLAIARSAEEQGKINKAIGAYSQVVEVDDKNAVAYYRLAVLHDKKGDTETAETLYMQAIELSPSNANIHCDLGYSYYLAGRWDEAEASFRRAVELAPDLSRAHNNLALLLARDGRIDEALFEFLQSGTSERDARTNVALALMLEGDRVGAKEQLQHASLLSDSRDGTRLSQLNKILARSEGRRNGGVAPAVASQAVHTTADESTPEPTNFANVSYSDQPSVQPKRENSPQPSLELFDTDLWDPSQLP